MKSSQSRQSSAEPPSDLPVDRRGGLWTSGCLEVDRYIATPGQALAYKCGQLEIMRLREEGKRRMGVRFYIHRFHGILLEGGGRPFAVIRDEMSAYFNDQISETTHDDTNFHL